VVTGWSNPLQSIVEHLAERLERSVIIDDSALRPLATSAQLGRLDDVRIAAVLHRRNDDRVLAWIEAHKVHQARGPVRIPASEELGTLARLVIPLLSDGRELGFLWLIDDPQLTAAQIEEAASAAAEASAVLAEQMARASESAETGRQLIDGLLAADLRTRTAAADQLRELAVLPEGPPYVLVTAIDDSSTAASAKTTRLTRAAAAAMSRVGDRSVICGSPRGGELVALTTGRRRDLVVRALRSAGSDLAIGTRAQLDALQAVHDAHADARFAAEVAAAVTRYQRTADWAELGPYAGLQDVRRTPESLERICPNVSALWARPSDMYEETARAYLKHGANAQRTAAMLHVHRTTLYWRLENIERLVGIDLSDGDDRLRLHLALTLKELMPKRKSDLGEAPKS
jgi:hypothetical protein